MPDRSSQSIRCNTIISVIALAMLLATSLQVISLPAASGDEGTWTFGVIGDTRDEHLDTATGVSPYLPILTERMAAEGLDLVIHNGDLINGYYTNESSPVHRNFTAMFDNWKSAMTPLYDYENSTGVPIYTIRGNHEDGEFWTDPELKAAYMSEIAELMPQNGPPGEAGLTYSFVHNGARFIMMDQYLGDTVVDKGAVNQLWLDDTLAGDSSTFTIVMSHTPAFRVSDNILISPPPNLYNQPAARDRFWDSIADAGVKVYFCGHAHLYCRGSLDGVQQVVIGDCGAGFEPYDPNDLMMKPEYPLETVNSSVHQIGYMMVTVNEGNGTMEMVHHLYDIDSHQWSVGDHFTIKVDSGKGASFDLLPLALVGAVIAVPVAGLAFWRFKRNS